MVGVRDSWAPEEEVVLQISKPTKWVELPDCVGADWEKPLEYHPHVTDESSNVGYANCKINPANATSSDGEEEEDEEEQAATFVFLDRFN